MNESIIKAKEVKVIYDEGKSNEVRSLMDINVEIFPEEYVIIHGPSGCGKSTLLYSIAGLQNPTYGKISVSGKELTEMCKDEKVELHQNVIGMIFQAFFLIESLSVIDNICLPMTFQGGELKTRRQEAMRLLGRFGISEQAHKFPGQLSGGQKQRVAIARALINNPQIILADEPVGNLDSESAANVMQIIKELNEVDKKTVILVTHNDEHLHFGDRIIGMRDGRIISEEINKDKRPIEMVKKSREEKEKEISPELQMLMRAFRNLTPKQAGALLMPFKSKQLLSHILSTLTEEQLALADNFLREFLFRNIDPAGLKDGLDKQFEQGGANWNKRKAESFSERAQEIMEQAEIVRKKADKVAVNLADYLGSFFELNLDEERKKKLVSFLEFRLENKLDHTELERKIDDAKVLGGLGLYKNIAERVVREVEIIMLMAYLG